MLDLTKVLAGVEPGLKLYCGYIKDGKEIGEVTLVCVDPSVAYPIKVQDKDGKFWWFTMTGGYMLDDEECHLSPADHVSWADFLVERNSVKRRFECGDVIQCILSGYAYHGCVYKIDEVTPNGYIVNDYEFIPIREEGLWKKL
jgi:hypothetical protein